MAVAIDATIGGASANSYVTQAEANTYFDDNVNFNATWDAYSSDEPMQRLISAAKAIDAMRLKGSKNATAQALKFPRAEQVDTAVIEQAIKDAQLEMVIYQALQQDTTGQVATDIESVRVEGAVAVKFRGHKPGGSAQASHGTIDRIRALMRDWLVGEGVWEVSV